MAPRIPSDEKIFTCDRGGELRLSLLSPAVVMIRHVGYLDATVLPPFRNAIDPIVQGGDIRYVFHDAWEFERYDTAYRVGMTEWARDARPYIVMMRAVIRSKVVAMGAAVANLALGGWLAIDSDRSVFDAAVDQAVAVTSRAR
jgi:hypothetical protein